MLPNRRLATGCERERKFPQRRKLVPLFGRISQDPFDRACFIIEAYKEIFSTRNDQGVIRAIVGNAVVMEPIGRCWINELAGIVSSGSHGRADDIGQVPGFQNIAGSVHLNVHRVVVCCGIFVQDNSDFATVDVMVEIPDSETTVIGKEGDCAIEVDSRQLAAMTQIGCVIKENGTTE